MATHSSVLAWRIPGTGEPGGLQSMGSQRVSATDGTTGISSAVPHMSTSESPVLETLRGKQRVLDIRGKTMGMRISQRGFSTSGADVCRGHQIIQKMGPWREDRKRHSSSRPNAELKLLGIRQVLEVNTQRGEDVWLSESARQ